MRDRVGERSRRSIEREDRRQSAPVLPRSRALPSATIVGHPGVALIGQMQARRVVAFAGRFHLYQGYTAEDVVVPIEIAAAAGARTIILTNAAGSLNSEYVPGDFMFIADHLNLMGTNPLIGTDRVERGEAFVDMVDAYAPLLRERAQSIASGQGLRTHTGTYAGVLGPSFETPAEARMLRSMGADAVGMSTVLETIAARSHGLAVLGISLITNVVRRIRRRPLDVPSCRSLARTRFASRICSTASSRRFSLPDTSRWDRRSGAERRSTRCETCGPKRSGRGPAPGVRVRAARGRATRSKSYREPSADGRAAASARTRSRNRSAAGRRSEAAPPAPPPHP